MGGGSAGASLVIIALGISLAVIGFKAGAADNLMAAITGKPFRSSTLAQPKPALAP